MEAIRNHVATSLKHPQLADVQDLDNLIRTLPEQELWQLLQNIIDHEIELEDDTVAQLDDRMQGFLFLQEYVGNRPARIEFARAPRHMSYLRDAAGSRNVWMSDEEFSQLVGLGDSLTLACFARSEQMKPHHLVYIVHKLAMQPHRDSLLATSDDARITLKKTIESQGNSPELALMRLAKAALDGSPAVENLLEQHVPHAQLLPDGDPRGLWQAYLNLKNLDGKVIRELLEGVRMSTSRPVGTSTDSSISLH